MQTVELGLFGVFRCILVHSGVADHLEGDRGDMSLWVKKRSRKGKVLSVLRKRKAAKSTAAGVFGCILVQQIAPGKAFE